MSNPFKKLKDEYEGSVPNHMPVLVSPNGQELVFPIPDDAFSYAGFFGPATGKLYTEAVLQHKAATESIVSFLKQSKAYERIGWFVPNEAKTMILSSLLADSMTQAAEALRYNGVSDMETVSASDERFSYEYRA